MCCNASTAFVLGLFGAAAPFEAARILLWDPDASKCCECRGTLEETAAFGILRLVQAQTESAPMLYLVMMIVTFDGVRKVWMEEPVLFLTAAISLINCAFALTHFITSPATEQSHRARDELLIHVYEPEVSHMFNYFVVKSKNPQRVRKTRRSFPMVLNLGIMAFFVSDLVLRVVALCVFTYAIGEDAIGFFVFGMLVVWVFVRITISLKSCGGEGGHGYRDALSLGEGAVRDLKRLLTPSFLDCAVTARRLSYDFVLTTLFSVLLVVVGLLPMMPSPHVDPDLIALAVMLTTGSVIIKYITFVWCVFPGLTLRYPILGVGKIYSKLEVAVAAITVQRHWRALIWDRMHPGAERRRTTTVSRRRRATTLGSKARGGRRRAGTEFQIKFVHKIKLKKATETDVVKVARHFAGDMDRTFGLMVYMLSLGFFKKCDRTHAQRCVQHRVCSVLPHVSIS
jgi:hypothetical protein